MNHALACAACVFLVTVSGLLPGCQSRGGSDRTPVASGGTIDQARELTRRADIAFAAGEMDRAESLYKQSLQILPDQPGALNNLGNVLVEKKMYIDADEVFRRAVALDPNRPETYGNRGRLWLEAGWPADAMRHFDDALRIDPRWLPALRGKAKASHLLGTVSEAYLRELRTAILIETDARWRAFFDRERVRVQQALQADV